MCSNNVVSTVYRKMGVASEIRHRYILEQLNLKGRIYVRNIAEKLDVTEVTIRRDLASMQKSDLLKKTYGGAVLASPEVNLSVRYRQKRKSDAKKIVGRLAAELIQDNDIIYIEAGSTCNEIVPFLEKKNNLTIIVNSLFLMRRLHEQPNHKIIIIGGNYRTETMDMVGPAAETAISQLGGFKAFTGADDITIDAGISGADIVTVGFAKLVLERASEVIFVGDNTKFDNPALYKISNIEELNYIVTNSKPSQQWCTMAQEKNIKLVYPN